MARKAGSRISDDDDAAIRRLLAEVIGVCPMCHRRVVLPCLACHLTPITVAHRPYQHLPCEPIGLDLRSDEYERYLKLRLAKETRNEISAIDEPEGPEGPSVEPGIPEPRHHGWLPADSENGWLGED